MTNPASVNTFNPERVAHEVARRNAESSVTPDYSDEQKFAEGAQVGGEQQQQPAQKERVTKHGTGQEADTAADQSPEGKSPESQQAQRGGHANILDKFSSIKNAVTGISAALQNAGVKLPEAGQSTSTAGRGAPQQPSQSPQQMGSR